jgi:hypothetical protein
MEVALFIAGLSLTLYVVLAFYDGFVLHIFKYRLYRHPDSQTEHLTHTIRAVLFPFIAYFLFADQNCNACFYIGIAAVTLDLGVMIWDAYIEKDSRAFMGGLPRWEYILHLMVNSFHFVAIAAMLILKVRITGSDIDLVTDLSALSGNMVFQALVVNLLPGSVLLALLHLLVLYPKPAGIWDNYRDKIVCC